MATDFLSPGIHPASLVLHGRYAEFIELRAMLKSLTVLTPEQNAMREHIIAEIDSICHFLENINAR